MTEEISAEQARDLMPNSPKVEEVLEKIFAEIRDVAKAGGTFVEFPSYLTYETAEYDPGDDPGDEEAFAYITVFPTEGVGNAVYMTLKELGYEFRQDKELPGRHYLAISWAKP